jgi:hypothetical protein
MLYRDVSLSHGRIPLSDLISNGEDLIAKLISDLTDGMVSISADDISFNGGPFGEIQGILNNFGLDFNGMINEFKSRYQAFNTDLQNMSDEKRSIFKARPISLPRFPSILQIGSKVPSIQYSFELNAILWDKLNTVFPNPTFNGVSIPNIPPGSTFAETFQRGDFPGKHSVQPHFLG